MPTKAKTEKAPMKAVKIELEPKKVIKIDDEPRETIEQIRHDKNPLITKVDKQWPNMYVVCRSEGGPPPAALKGLYTSQVMAKRAILRHLG